MKKKEEEESCSFFIIRLFLYDLKRKFIQRAIRKLIFFFLFRPDYAAKKSSRIELRRLVYIIIIFIFFFSPSIYEKKVSLLSCFSSICTDTEKKITHDFVEAPSRAALVIEGEKSFFFFWISKSQHYLSIFIPTRRK